MSSKNFLSISSVLDYFLVLGSFCSHFFHIFFFSECFVFFSKFHSFNTIFLFLLKIQSVRQQTFKGWRTFNRIIFFFNFLQELGFFLQFHWLISLGKQLIFNFPSNFCWKLIPYNFPSLKKLLHTLFQLKYSVNITSGFCLT